MDASADPEYVQPSLAHTARATTVLRRVRSETHRTEVEQAVRTALDWIIESQAADDGTTEILRSEPKVRGADVPVSHFTSAWTLRAMAGIERVPHVRRQVALDALWDCYTRQGLWVWRSDASVPSWMTCDGIAALKANALHSSLTPLVGTS